MLHTEEIDENNEQVNAKLHHNSVAVALSS